MNNILIFAGTTEGRELSEILSKKKIEHTVCVATEYASLLIKDNEYARVHCERLDASEMVSMIKEGGFALVIDATHPYAYEVSDNIKSAAKETGIKYIRLKRDIGSFSQNDKIRFFSTNEECAEALKQIDGNILLTTGSKELHVYASDENVRERLFVRIIPNEESLKICNDNGIHAKNIIAMQGPFSKTMNDAMIDMYDISAMVSKQCGKNGGFENKVLSAIEKDIPLYIIGCEESEEGINLKETLKEVSNFIGKSVLSVVTYNISLIGTGMGDKSLLTHEASKALDEADMVMGAKRLINSFAFDRESTYPIYKSEDIIAKIKEYQEKDSVGRINVAVLFSGDSSFFSGATSLYNALMAEKEAGRIIADINILPGISSVSSFASKIGVAYSDANILSIHGRNLNNLTHRIRCNKDTFLLASDGSDIKKIGKDLIQAGLSDVSITLGVNLSYDDEKIITLTPSECETTDVEGIIICYINNPSFESKRVTPGLKDEAFSRNTTPMTKEEVREVSISKLGLKSDSILLDIGAGTGSISIESALLSDDIKVFAIEKKKEALDILRENTSKFNLDNITIVEGEAPSALEEIHEATHAFIGGSGGQLKEILNKLYKINPTMRVVINAVTIETITEIGSLEGDYKIENYEMVMMQISHSSKVGYYNMMKAENPIWICSFNFC